MQTVKLLLTVSGGLEELAEKQVRTCFGEKLRDLKCHRKPSGSQLYLTLRAHDVPITAQIAGSMKRLDYVEYVFALLDSFRMPGVSSSDRGHTELLQLIENAASQIPQSSIDFCKGLCEAATCQSSVDAGLKGLPGLLLPTPEISLSTHPPKTNLREFQVNTVYTKPNVAQAVIETISEVCQQQNYQSSSDKAIWVDAGSGDGALLEHMPPTKSIGVDSHPASSRVRQMDFLELSKSWLNHEFPDHERLVVVSNPPFALSSRGDYSPIVEFINHSFDVLGADVVAVICPSKFARERIWKSLYMTEVACLLSRFFLPPNAFYNPQTGAEVNIHSYCLIFGHKSKQSGLNEETTMESTNGVYLSAKRDKGLFPHLATADLTKTVVSGLTKAGMEFAAERNAKYLLNAKLVDHSSLELWWHINPRMPCSLANSNAIKVPNHSLGWISLSIKPPVALTMVSMAVKAVKDDCSKSRLAVNLMSGEGTIELEAGRAVGHSFFLVSGDKSHNNALKTAKRVQSLEPSNCRRLLVDVVMWDAQNLPLRRGLADVVLADLPFQGSLKKAHQEPKVGKISSASAPGLSPPLSYFKVLGEASRILKAKGCAALLSPDAKALRHASGRFNWSQLGYSTNVNIGGLNATLLLMERKEACTKDLSMWVPSSTSDLSPRILAAANKFCEEGRSKQLEQAPLISNVHLRSTFFHEQKQSLSHCYRMTFDNMVRNVEAKQVERLIRHGLENELVEEGIILR